VVNGSKAERHNFSVLMVLAEMSNEGGVCWPSMATLSKRCRKSDRAVQASLKALVALGELDIDYNAGPHGTNRYRIRLDVLRPPKSTSPSSPEARFTPEEPGGCSVRHDHPEARGTGPPKSTAPEPYEEPSSEPSLKGRPRRSPRSADRLDLLPDVDRQLLADWSAVRKAKRAGPITATVVNGLRVEASKAGMSCSEVITLCCQRGWQGFNADWASARKADARATALAWAPGLVNPPRSLDAPLALTDEGGALS